MSKEIKELDNKYLVLKWDDINRTEALHPNLRGAMNAVITSIDIDRSLREPQKKPSRKNEYLVLNLDDDISIQYLHDIIHDYFNKLGKTEEFYTVKTKYLAHHLVNAILKAKEQTR